MKSAFQSVLLIVTFLGASSAFAGQWHLACNNMAGDGGYAVTFSPDGSSAEVQQNSIAGAKSVATLLCTAEPEKGFDDEISVTNCFEPHRAATLHDNAYSAKLETGGFAGIRKVTLRHGRARVAVITCHSEQ